MTLTFLCAEKYPNDDTYIDSIRFILYMYAAFDTRQYTLKSILTLTIYSPAGSGFSKWPKESDRVYVSGSPNDILALGTGSCAVEVI